MRHVKDIRILFEQGQQDEAFDAIDQLLSLGPNNLDALKLKALILSNRGQYREEAKLWEQIIELDNEDADAIYYFHKRYIEEREKFYFTDEIPTGGRQIGRAHV